LKLALQFLLSIMLGTGKKNKLIIHFHFIRLFL